LHAPNAFGEEVSGSTPLFSTNLSKAVSEKETAFCFYQSPPLQYDFFDKRLKKEALKLSFLVLRHINKLNTKEVVSYLILLKMYTFMVQTNTRG
jgi:hypothetical protein